MKWDESVFIWREQLQTPSRTSGVQDVVVCLKTSVVPVWLIQTEFT